MKRLLYIGNHLQSKHANRAYASILGPLLEREGFQLSYASHKKNKLLRLLDMLWCTFVYRSKVKLVLIDTYSTQNFYYALLVSQLCRVLKLPYIPLLHGGNLPHRLQNNPNLSQHIFKHAALNIAPSLYLKGAFEAKGYTNITYIPNSIELSNYPFIHRTFDTSKLLWVRSFASLYNPQLAVQVLKALRDQGWDAELCMVGPDSDGSFAEVKALAKRLNIKVTFTGKLTKPEWTALATYYNVFINTTNFDNTPVSVIEAMALGLPVVSTNVGGMPYLITHDVDGLLVPPKDVEAMVAAILHLFEDPSKREQLIMNARNKVEGFDWEVVRSQWRLAFGC
uniref:glycosyltransferase family 4 protein n=2 Tax=Gelidibacter sp. TaxID=2018083 RepID=UPI004049C57D